MMAAPLSVLALLSATPKWESNFFENVRLHKGSAPVTVEVAWLESDVVSTDSAMPAVVSVFEGSPGARHLVSSTKIGDVSYDRAGGFFATEPKSSEGFLVLQMVVSGKSTTTLFGFEGRRPKRVLQGFGLNADELGKGIVREESEARGAGFRPPPGDHPNPPIERVLRFDAESRTFKPGPWREGVFNPPAIGEVKGRVNGHTFRVRLVKRNFRLGRRKVVLAHPGLLVGGLKAYGTDMPSAEDLKSPEKNRDMFMTELTSFEAWIDGSRLRVPGRLWKSCFDPHLKPSEDLFAWLSKDGKRLVVKMYGSDAAGGYVAIWTLRRNGTASRAISFLD